MDDALLDALAHCVHLYHRLAEPELAEHVTYLLMVEVEEVTFQMVAYLMSRRRDRLRRHPVG